MPAKAKKGSTDRRLFMALESIIDRTVKDPSWWAALFQQALSIYIGLIGVLGTVYVAAVVINLMR